MTLRSAGIHSTENDPSVLLCSFEFLMVDSRSTASHGKAFWSLGDVVRGDVAGLFSQLGRVPVNHWSRGMLFGGARDRSLMKLTGGRFPSSSVPGKTHPVFCLAMLPDGVGALACPCTSRRPHDEINRRYVRKGCRLASTGRLLDRHSYLIETARFNVPRSVAGRLHFWGEAPRECVQQRPIGSTGV